MGTAGTLSSGNILPDSLINFIIASCSFEPGTTGEFGDTMLLASKKFILLSANNVEHIDKVRGGICADVLANPRCSYGGYSR